ncbi:MAG: SagB/ThcOx family dehydrogenase, partial [Promethearchaeota archaeon]
KKAKFITLQETNNRMSFDKETINKFRRVLKVISDDLFPEGFQTDQQKKVPNPPLQKPYPEDATIIDLVEVDNITCGKATPLFDVIKNRESRRVFTEDPLTLEELSFLLWATQGVHAVTKHHGAGTKRTVPSGGARHAYETYLVINRVEGLQPGLYRYLAIEHKLLFLKTKEEVNEAKLEKIAPQSFVLRGAVIFVWAAVPYRMEWRYSIAASKGIAQEAGHICQNLYLACEAIGAGTCGINAYRQEIIDELFELDGEDEFTVYIAPVGKIKK